MLYIPLSVIILCAIFAGCRKWKRQRAAKLFKATLPDPLYTVRDPKVVVHSIVLCNRAIVCGIDSMLSLSALEESRSNRVLDTLFSGYEAFRKSDPRAQGDESLNYIWYTGLKISEITREIAFSKDTPLTECEEIDIAEVRDDIMDLTKTLGCPNTNHDDIRMCVAKVKESVCAHIRRYSNSMKHSDYNDGNIRYSYLRLLHYLYSYFLSMQKIV